MNPRGGRVLGGGSRKRTRESSPPRGATAMSARSRGRAARGFAESTLSPSSSSLQRDTATSPSHDVTEAMIACACMSRDKSRPCRGCAVRLMRDLIIGEDALSLQTHRVESLFLDDDDEEEQAEALLYCPICSAFKEISHGHGTILIDLEQVRGRWSARMKGEGWLELLDAVQSVSPQEGRTSKIVPVHPPAGRRCPACGGAAGERLYCTFACMVLSSGAAAARRYPWAGALIGENFEAPCRIDRLCDSFPSIAYSSYSCGEHHRPEHQRANSFGQTLDQSRSLQGMVKTMGGKVLVEHGMDDGESRCIGICTACGDQVEEEECTQFSRGHPCFTNDWRRLELKSTTSSNKRYRRDMFCLDCQRAYSSMLCTHHHARSHRTIRVLPYDRRYFCVCITRNTPSVDAFDAVKELPEKDPSAGAGRRLVPIRLLGAATRCDTCRLVLEDTGHSHSCSFNC